MRWRQPPKNDPEKKICIPLMTEIVPMTSTIERSLVDPENNVSVFVQERTRALIEKLEPKLLEDGSLCPSEDGACLRWPAKKIYCEIFDEATEAETFMVNLFGDNSDVMATKMTADLVAASTFLIGLLK